VDPAGVHCRRLTRSWSRGTLRYTHLWVRSLCQAIERTMGQRGRPPAALVLSNDQRHQLERSAYGTRNPSVSLRCRIVLRCADGHTNREVAQHLGVSEAMVSTWRRRYRARGFDGLFDRARPGVSRSITDDQIHAVIAATLEGSSPAGTAWTKRSMEKATGISASSVWRIWHEYGLDPHRVNIFLLSADPQFVANVRDVGGLYLDPPGGALVLWVDQPAAVQAARPAVQMSGLGAEAADPWRDDDQSHGAGELHRSLEMAGRLTAGQAMTKQIERTRDRYLRSFLDQIDQSAPQDLDVYVVVDHSATTMTDGLAKWLRGHLRFELHTAPTYTWWMQLVERWFAHLTDRGWDGSTAEVAASINDWIETWSTDAGPFAWF